MKYNIIIDSNIRLGVSEGSKVMLLNDAIAKSKKITMFPAGYEFITLPIVALNIPFVKA